jgi:ribonuclease HII
MTIMGIDEVGRGCWAGPLVAGAVVLSDDYIHGASMGWKLADSKKMSKMQRDKANSGIRGMAAAYGIGWVTSQEVDDFGLTKAVSLAMERAVIACNMDVDQIIIDGSYNFLPDMANVTTIVKADASQPTVSAASILAKVARDNWMAEAEVRFPGYGFASHVGYGTAAHRTALQALGICELHRRSFKPIALL